jgi:hypothetical protein
MHLQCLGTPANAMEMDSVTFIIKHVKMKGLHEDTQGVKTQNGVDALRGSCSSHVPTASYAGQKYIQSW